MMIIFWEATSGKQYDDTFAFDMKDFTSQQKLHKCPKPKKEQKIGYTRSFLFARAPNDYFHAETLRCLLLPVMQIIRFVESSQSDTYLISYLSDSEMIFVWSGDYICLKWRLYLSEVEIIFVWSGDYICLRRRWYLSEVEIIFVWSQDYICLKRRWYLSVAQWEQCDRRCLEPRQCPAGNFCYCTVSVLLRMSGTIVAKCLLVCSASAWIVNCARTYPHALHFPIHVILHRSV